MAMKSLCLYDSRQGYDVILKLFEALSQKTKNRHQAA